MTLFRGTFLDTPRRPVHRRRAAGRGRRRAAGRATASSPTAAPFAAAAAGAPGEDVVDLRGGLVLPGFVDTHVHFPQVRCIGGARACRCWTGSSGAPCRRRRGWPTPATPAAVAAEFVAGWPRPGTTTALVFGAHFAAAVDALFAEAARRGLRITSGLVVSDRLLRAGPAHHAAARVRRGAGAGAAVARRRPQPRTPSPRASRSRARDDLLDVLRGAARATSRARCFTSHVNENAAEIAARRRAVRDGRRLPRHLRPARPGRPAQRPRAQRAPDRRELERCWPPPARPSRTARPATAALGSGLFPLRAHVDARRPGRARLRRRRRHRVLAVQGGPPGLLRAAASRRAQGSR